jgi:hypothetical protein
LSVLLASANSAHTQSIPVQTRTQQSPRGSRSAQGQETSTGANIMPGFQCSPQPTSRSSKKTVLMSRNVLDNRQASLRTHRSVPDLDIQGLEGDLAYNRADQMRSAPRAGRACTSGRCAHVYLTDKPKPEDEFSVAKAAAAKVQLDMNATTHFGDKEISLRMKRCRNLSLHRAHLRHETRPHGEDRCCTTSWYKVISIRRSKANVAVLVQSKGRSR